MGIGKKMDAASIFDPGPGASALEWKKSRRHVLFLF
jgi:hypothetical protein